MISYDGARVDCNRKGEWERVYLLTHRYIEYNAHALATVRPS